MQGVKALMRARHSFKRVGFFSQQQRGISALPHYAPHDDLQNQVSSYSSITSLNFVVSLSIHMEISITLLCFGGKMWLDYFYSILRICF